MLEKTLQKEAPGDRRGSHFVPTQSLLNSLREMEQEERAGDAYLREQLEAIYKNSVRLASVR